MDPTTDRPTFYYVEHDGMVYLVEREGRLTFPTKEEELPFEVELRVEIDYEDAKVLFCVPHLTAWPRDWTFKDKVPGMRNVDPLVHRAINASFIREVSGAVIIKGGVDASGTGKNAEMLMVKASRGFTRGMWNIPGGFVTFGETPEASIVREVHEETGLDIRVRAPLGVYTARFASPYFMRGHMFLCDPLTEDLRLAPDEIADAQWMPLKRAYEETLNPFCRGALEACWERT